MAPVRERRHVRLSRAAIALAAAVWLTAPWTPARARADAPIVAQPGRYGPYYHLRLELTAADVDFAASDRRARSGGQFQLRLRRDRFPVAAPRCRGPIILRMPWTAPDTPDAADKIAAKEALLARLLALAEAPGEAVAVVLELNPYVEVVSRTPLRVRLTGCNVFFRQAFGAYVDRTGPV